MSNEQEHNCNCGHDHDHGHNHSTQDETKLQQMYMELQNYENQISEFILPAVYSLYSYGEK